MSRTGNDLVKFVLRDVLAVIDSAETASADEADTVTEIYVDLYEKLKDDGLAEWPIWTIPNDVVRPLADIVGYTAGPSFGVSKGSLLAVDGGRSMSISDAGMLALRRRMAKRATGEPVQAEYF